MSPEYFAQIIRRFLPEPHASLMNGILLGIPLKNQWQLYQELISVGLVHMIVLSGMNITLLIQLISSVLFFLPKKLKIACVIATIVFFTIFVGIQPPIMRAAIMGIISLCGLQIGRKVCGWYSLIITALISLIIWPDWVSSISFYLSYASTSGLILLPKPISIKALKQRPISYVLKYCADDLQTSIAAQIFTLPLIWYYFGRISLISPITNLLVSWTIGPLMILGFLTCTVGALSSSIGKITGFFSYILISYILTVVHLFS